MAGYELLKNLMGNSNSGIVTFTLPSADGNTDSSNYWKTVKGCLIGDISIKLSNKWQAMLPNIDAITLASQIISSDQNALAWTASTQSAWMGSEPLRLTIPFYLFSFNDSSKISDKVNLFRQLLGPYKVGSSSFKVKLHGGYTPDVFEDMDWEGGLGVSNTNIADSVKKGNVLGHEVGLIKIQVGKQFMLTKMLLEDLVTENSTIHVEDGNPLYIKVTATFKSYRVLFSQEISEMFKKQS